MYCPRLPCLALVALLSTTAACGGCGDDDDDVTDADDADDVDDTDDVDDDGGDLSDFLPDIPAPTGDDQAVFAGSVEAGNAEEELLPGSAATGAVGDLYLRNARGRFIVQAPGRLFGVIPQGGNLIDAQRVGPDGPVAEDHFGELSSIYLLGRTCNHQEVEVVQDGSGGGVAAIVARGTSDENDFINIKGIGLLQVGESIDPQIPDQVECATTYILAPDSPRLEVYWTFYNAGADAIAGPFAALSDTGGNIEMWSPTRGFERAGIGELVGGGPAPVTYTVYQGPGVAYGVVPRHATADVTNASFLIAGVAIVLYGADALLDIVNADGIYFELPGQDGVTYGTDFIIGRDASDVEAAVLAKDGVATEELSGEVLWDDGTPAAGARVGVYTDVNDDGVIGIADDVISYMDTDDDGLFVGSFAPGDYLLRADVADEARSEVLSSSDGSLMFVLDRPVRYDYRIVDDETGDLIPAKILVIGDNAVRADSNVFPTFDTFRGQVDMIHAIRGSSTDLGDGADPAIVLPPGTDYRVLVSRGTEWSVAQVVLSPVAGEDPDELELRMRRVIDTTGYIASEYHVHSIGSPDSPVEWTTRVATAAADGVELFASTEHEYVADLQPFVEALGLEGQVRALPGIEVTPFAYGHFNAWPVEPDLSSPNHGAIDWARGADGFALTPGEIFSAMRERGAELVQANHPRSAGGLGDFQNYFDRAALTFDYAARTIFGDVDEQSVPNDFLRLPPGASLWDASFNALEVWNGFGTGDTDEDGVREIVSLDLVMGDWFNFLSFGLIVAPIGNSDTHTIVRDPMGMPRTMVAVPDDSSGALVSGAIVEPLIDNLTASGDRPHDIVVTDGPFIRVTRTGDDQSAIGATLTPEGGAVELTISVQSPDWAEFDVIEVFANTTPETGASVSALLPVKCYVTVAPGTLGPNDPCNLAPLAAEQMDVDLVTVSGPFQRFEASVDLVLTAEDPIHPEGGTGDDAWVVVRARGSRAVYPVILNDDLLNLETLPTLLAGDPGALDTLLTAEGVPASAFTAPIYLDLDGGGYLAPFAPE